MFEYYDEIRIENLECFAYHGVYPQENENGQNFYVNTVLYTDTRKAALCDDLNLTTSYGEVARFIHEFMKNTYKLLEKVAEEMAAGILLRFPLVEKLDLEIRKPHAPIALNFESVSVKITRGWQRVYLGVGSNLGKSEQLIQHALSQIGTHSYVKELRVSKLLRSAPYGVKNQPDFVNGAITFFTLFTPYELLGFLKELESAAGRDRESKSVRWGARTLDLDILLFGDIIMDEEDLTIPHPDLHHRDFVLLPLLHLNRYLKHPTLNRSMKDLLDQLGERYALN